MAESSGPRLSTERRLELGGSFRAGADEYDAIRPGYPDEIARWMIPQQAVRVADIGAGTGKFTARLIEHGFEVTAVDPSANMLERLSRNHPQATTVVGSGEATGLPDRALDAVAYAQAWHWCDPYLASTEAARILRPGGSLAITWNQFDVRVPWVHRLSRIMHAGDVYKPDSRPVVGPEFGPFQSHVTQWTDPLTPEQLLRLVRTRSYYLCASNATRERVDGNLSWYLYEHLEYVPGVPVDLPYITQSWRAQKTGPADRFVN